jgi:MYXO-CTERM domain-containing protein
LLISLKTPRVAQRQLPGENLEVNMLRRLAAVQPLMWLLWSASAWAAPLPSNLVVTGSVSLDASNSSSATGGATQGGSLTLIKGGAGTTISFTGPLLLPLPTALTTGTLLRTGDGIEASLTMAGSTPGAANDIGLFIDYALSLNNSSASASYVVTFRSIFNNNVRATGTDSYAYSDISVKNAAGGEVAFSDREVDTKNSSNNWSLGSANSTFSVALAPGESTSFTALQRLRGGNFAGGQFSGGMDARIVVDSVTVSGDSGTVSSVPMPESMPLALSGLLTLALLRRRA